MNPKNSDDIEMTELRLVVDDLERDRAVLVGVSMGLICQLQWHVTWLSLGVFAAAGIICWRFFSKKPVADEIITVKDGGV